MHAVCKAKATTRNSRDGHLSGLMDVMIGERNSNSIKRELDSIINCPDRQPDFQSLRNRETSSREDDREKSETLIIEMDQLGKKDYLSLLTYCPVR